MPLYIVRDDITQMKVDAIVNPAGRALRPNRGLSGAIHRAAGPEVTAQCRALGGCRLGGAKITGAGRLPCRYIIHAVPPRWWGGLMNERGKLHACYCAALSLAQRHGCETLAFPLLSDGKRGFPKGEALRIAVDAISRFLDECEMTVYLVTYDREAYLIGSRLYQEISRFIDSRYEQAETLSSPGAPEPPPQAMIAAPELPLMAPLAAPEPPLPEEREQLSAARLFPRPAAPETAVPETAVPETAVPEMAVPELCPRCGGDLPAGSRFCPRCGGDLPAGSRFCPRCGVPVRELWLDDALEADAWMPADLPEAEPAPAQRQELPLEVPLCPASPERARRQAAHGLREEPVQASLFYPLEDKTLEELLGMLDESFSQMLLRKIDERGMTDVQCYKKANISRKLFSKIRSDPLYRPSKQTALAFAIALELPLEETREMLGKAGFALSRSSKFDIIVEYFISRGRYDIFEINEALFTFDQNLLGA